MTSKPAALVAAAMAAEVFDRDGVADDDWPWRGGGGGGVAAAGGGDRNGARMPVSSVSLVSEGVGLCWAWHANCRLWKSNLRYKKMKDA